MNDFDSLRQLLTEQLRLLKAAASVLEESHARVAAFRDDLRSEAKTPLSVGQRESCEALTSRFARLNDLLLQRVFRTLDRMELVDDSSLIDRLERAERRGLIDSAEHWRELRLLRNAIAHDYLIEAADRVLTDALDAAPELLQSAARIQEYVRRKGYA